MHIKNTLSNYLKQNNDLSESKLSNLIQESMYLNTLISGDSFPRVSISLLTQYKRYATRRIKHIKLQLSKRNEIEENLLSIFEPQTTIKGERKL